jgi:hypothetical protein
MKYHFVRISNRLLHKIHKGTPNMKVTHIRLFVFRSHCEIYAAEWFWVFTKLIGQL